MSTEYEFDCKVCGTRHEPCIDMAKSLEREQLRARQENRLNCGGCEMSVALLEVMLSNLNEHGELHIENLKKGSVRMLDLGATLCANYLKSTDITDRRSVNDNDRCNS